MLELELLEKRSTNVEKVGMDCHLSGQHNGSLVFELTVNYLAFVKLVTIEFDMTNMQLLNWTLSNSIPIHQV